jgi:hypothetical protein
MRVCLSLLDHAGIYGQVRLAKILLSATDHANSGFVGLWSENHWLVHIHS